MTNNIHFQTLLAENGRTDEQKLALFAWLNLGIVESLANGLMTATDAVRILFNAENCLYVRHNLPDHTADEIMSHGVQLPDLFDALPGEEVQREFLRELSRMRSLCLTLLEEKQIAA